MYLTNENILGEKCWMGSSHQATDPDNPQWVAPSLCIKILNFIREGKIHIKTVTQPSVLLFSQIHRQSHPSLSGLAASEENP